MTSETKRYILYSEIEVEENQVDCIYFVERVCIAQPIGRVAGGGTTGQYKPTEEDQKRFCKNEAAFRACPRFTAYQEHLRVISLEK